MISIRYCKIVYFLMLFKSIKEIKLIKNAFINLIYISGVRGDEKSFFIFSFHNLFSIIYYVYEYMNGSDGNLLHYSHHYLDINSCVTQYCI